MTCARYWLDVTNIEHKKENINYLCNLVQDT